MADLQGRVRDVGFGPGGAGASSSVVFKAWPASLLATVVLGAGISPAAGQVSGHPSHLLGRVAFPVSCSTAAQAAFDRAMALLHHMTYPQAREAFEQVAVIDSGCAMAHWGVAMTLFQPLWPTRPGPDDLRRGWDALQQARALGPATDRERQFVATAEAFFQEPASPTPA